MHFQRLSREGRMVLPGQSRRWAGHRPGGRGGAEVKREGWERKPTTSCAGAAISHLWAQNKMRTFPFPRGEAVCSGHIRNYLHCRFRPLVHLLGKWQPWRKRSNFPEHLCPTECYSQIQLFSRAVSLLFIFTPGDFQLACLSWEQAKMPASLFHLEGVPSSALSVFQLGSLFLLTSKCTSVWRN